MALAEMDRSTPEAARGRSGRPLARGVGAPRCRPARPAPGTKLRSAPILALAACAALSASAQAPPEGETPRLAEVAKVKLVLLPTTVTDRKGKPVSDLGPKDFQLLDEGEPRTIEFFATEREAPIALAFLLDVSASMKLGDRLVQAQAAIRTFVESLGPRDRFGLICFADGQVQWVTGFTSDRARFLSRLEAQRAAGRTALYDALAASPGLVDEEIRGRKAIVLITDGLDNASRLPMLRAVWMARRVNVPIYTLSFIPMRERLLPRRARDALRVVGRFSLETGGTLFPVYGTRDLHTAVATVQAELRLQYVIGYSPRAADLDGSFRTLKLVPRREGLEVRTRRGYYANP